MKTDYDVIIIGAGPAGASCAKHLVENGIKTLILEKRKLPRYKCCGGLISVRAEEALKKLGLYIPTDLFCKPYNYKVKLSKGSQNFYEIPKMTLKSVVREKFDLWLINKSNAEISENSYYINHYEETNFLTVNFIKDDKRLKCTTKFLLGADGGGSVVRKNIDRNYNLNNFVTSYQVVYEGNASFDENSYYFIKSKEFSDVLSWFNYKNNYIYIGISFLIKKNREYYFNKTYNFINSMFDLKLKYLRKEVCIMKASQGLENFIFGNKNILLIGEASGLLAVLGEGIPSALISGRLAAESIIESLNNNNLALNIYSEKISEEKNYVISTWKMIR